MKIDVTNYYEVDGYTEVELPEGKTMMEINQQIQMLMGQPEELAKFINLQASGE